MAIIGRVFSRVIDSLEGEGISVTEISFQPVDLKFKYSGKIDKEKLRNHVNFLEKYYARYLNKGINFKNLKVFINFLDLNFEMPYSYEMFQWKGEVKNIMVSDFINLTVRMERYGKSKN